MQVSLKRIPEIERKYENAVSRIFEGEDAFGALNQARRELATYGFEPANPFVVFADDSGCYHITACIPLVGTQAAMVTEIQSLYDDCVAGLFDTAVVGGCLHVTFQREMGDDAAILERNYPGMDVCEAAVRQLGAELIEAHGGSGVGVVLGAFFTRLADSFSTSADPAETLEQSMATASPA